MHLSALERMTRLLEVSAALSKTMTRAQVAHVMLTAGLEAVGALGGALLTVDEEAGEYVVAERRAGAATPAESRLSLQDGGRLATCARERRASVGGGGAVCLPLVVRGHCIGAVEVDLAAEADVDDECRAFLEATADQCAQAIERAHLYWLEQVRRSELERSNRMKDDFLGIVSHELRTPLSAILGWARMLRRGIVSGPAADRALRAIERNATLQAHLVDDLLDVSRIVSGKLELELASADAAAIVDAAIESVRPALLAKGLDVRLHLPRDSAVVLGDTRRLQQVMWNLLTNAVKFTPAGGRIDVKLERDTASAKVTVTDTGVGIPADVLPHVFERFKQGDGSATRRHGGLGLGLAIVRHVVEAHGGSVYARSEGEGKGTEMVVELPLTDSDSVRQLRTAESQSDAAGALKGARVLLVDDDDDTRDFLATALRAAGADLREAAGACAAFDLVRDWRPHVIVSDVAMPDKDGYALIREVRSLDADAGGRTPAVALTALARSKDRVRALAAGFQTHMPKPVDPGELVLAVANLRDALG
jgi:signal transduction histidine kinase/CheY-like chemotaxis protein